MGKCRAKQRARPTLCFCYFIDNTDYFNVLTSGLYGNFPLCYYGSKLTGNEGGYDAIV
jgi:hypothetical protein